jgi:hypothetical protein
VPGGSQLQSSTDGAAAAREGASAAASAAHSVKKGRSIGVRWESWAWGLARLGAELV